MNQSSPSRAADLGKDYERYVLFWSHDLRSIEGQSPIFSETDWEHDEHMALLKMLNLAGSALAIDFTTKDGPSFEDTLHQLISNDNTGKQALMLLNEKADMFNTVYQFCPNTLVAAIKAVMKGVALDIL